jgi:hypothetical protein
MRLQKSPLIQPTFTACGTLVRLFYGKLRKSNRELAAMASASLLSTLNDAPIAENRFPGIIATSRAMEFVPKPPRDRRG